MEKTVTLNAEEYERLLLIDSAEDTSKGNSWSQWITRIRKHEPFRTLDEVALDIPSIRPISVSFIGCRRRTKDVLLSYMYKDEIQCWMEEADREEKQQQQQGNSRNDGLRKRLNRESDEDFTE